MKRLRANKKFLIYRSPSHSYLRFLLIALPLFVFWLAGETGASFLYAAALGLFAVCLVFLVQLYAFLLVDDQGVRLIRLLGKNHTIPWEEIHYHGTLRIPHYGSSASACLLYVSRNPVPGNLSRHGTLPQLTEDFLFAAVQPGLAEAIGNYLP